MRTVHHVFHLGIKELRGLLRDPMLMAFIVLAFTVMLYASSTATPESLHKATLAIIDEDRSPLSQRVIDSFYPPYFLPPSVVTPTAAVQGMDAGRYTFAVHFPPGFQRDVLAGRSPAIQVDIDATRMSQAFTGSGYIQAIVTGAVNEFVQGHRAAMSLPVELVLRARFNSELNASWFSAMMHLVDQITLLSIILTGAALLREREHGTVEHLLVMPVTPFEIMAAKVWSMGLAVIVAAALSLRLVVQGVLGVPIEGSILLFLAGATVHLFATTSLGIFIGTYARSMPQFGLLLMLVILPLQILSGGSTPRESMPEIVRTLMLGAPTTHFVMLGQAILYRGAGLSVVWPQFLSLIVIGASLFALSLGRFRKTLATMV